MTFVATIFLSFDIFIQHVYGQDLFGYTPWHDRYAGIFNDEAIAGSYIQKFAFISIPIIIFFKQLNLSKKVLITLIISALGLGILMSTDRMPFLIYIIQIIILIFIAKKNKFLYLINLIIILFLFLLIFENNKIINKRYEFLYSIKNLVITNAVTKDMQINNSTLKDFNNSNNYFHIFYTGYEIWKKNPIIGTGVKSFNISCSEASKTNNKLLCAPHAHNLYLEILINTGIAGIFILIIYIFNILKEVKNILSKKNNTIYLYLLIIFVAELFPLRSYGSIFQTVNGSMFWYLLALTSIIKFQKILIKY
jgi:O-antigen ligase